jgi:hypothetical protein
LPNVIKWLLPVAAGGALAGAIAFGAGGGLGGDSTPPSELRAPTPLPTEDDPTLDREREPTPRARATSTPVVRPTFTPIPVATRVVTPGLDRGGLFGDGIQDLSSVDTSDWRTYTNSKWSYSFKYPKEWEIEEFEGAPTGSPIQWVRARNRTDERGENVPGQNCQGALCEAAPPGVLNFGVTVDHNVLGASCPLLGPLIVQDSRAVSGKQAQRCVVLQVADSPPTVRITIPLDQELVLGVLLEKGRQRTSRTDQAILETILSTLIVGP